MASKTATKAIIDAKIPDNTSGQVTPATERDAINAVLDMVTAAPVGALAGLTWNLADDGYKKTLTLTADTTVTAIIEDGADGFLFVTGAGHTLTVGLQAPGDLVLFNSLDIATAAVGVTGVVVSNAGGFMWAEGRNLPTPNINPPAPTNGVVDDTNNTFAYTIPGGYVLADVEGQINGGAIGAVANPMVVGNVNAAIGQVRVRIKAAAGRNASAWLANATAFTATSGASPVRFTSLTGIAETGSMTNVWRGSGSNFSDQYAVDASRSFTNGTNFGYAQTITDSDNHFTYVVLDDDIANGPTKDGSGGTLVNYFLGYAPGFGDIFFGGKNAPDQTFPITLPSGAMLKLNVSGTPGSMVVTAEYSTDNGATWQVAGTITGTGGAFPTGPMYAKTGFSVGPNRELNQPQIL